MTIAMIAPVAAGNALRVFMQPPAGATMLKLLRRLDNAFSGPSDPDAAVAYEGTESCVVDAGVANAVSYFYRAYYRVAGAWQPSNAMSSTPAATYVDLTTDVVSVVQARLAAALAVEVERGNLVHEDNLIPVLTAPPATEQARWPLVTIHMEGEDPQERFIGEQLGDDAFDDVDQEWQQSEGWLAKVQLSIVGWALNSDERLELRRALRRIVIANLPVFEAAGITNVEFSQQDMEDFEGYNAPVYQAVCRFSCLSPVAVASNAGVIVSTDQAITAP